MRSRIISAVLLLLIFLPYVENCNPHEHNGENEVSFLSGLLSPAKNIGSAPANSVNAQSVISGMYTQSNWAWCHKCQGLFYYGLEQPNSICPRDGLPHEAIPSGIYYLPFLTSGQPLPSGYQDHWHWCKNCQAIWYDSPGAPNVCPNGGAHDATGSASYALSLNTASPNSQQGWRWCNQCGALHFGPNVSLSMCPATHGNHSVTGSGDYYINLEPNVMTQINQMELALSVETGSTGGIAAAGQILGQSIFSAPSNPLPYYPNNATVQDVKIANAPDRGLSYIAYSRGDKIRFASAPRSQFAPGNFTKTDLPASNFTFSTLSSFGFVYFKGNFYLSYVGTQGNPDQSGVYRSSDCITWTHILPYSDAGNYNHSSSAVVTGAGSASEKIWVSYAAPITFPGVKIQTSTDGSAWNTSNYSNNNAFASSAQLAALSNGEAILAFSKGGVGVVPIQYVISTNGVFPNNTANIFPNSPSSNIFREIDIVTTGTDADVFLTFIDSGSNSTAYLRRYNLQNGTQLQSTTYTAPSGGVFQKPSVNLMPRFY
ncbi:hypothetical protein [Leptospira andrefontaineae]|uniref:Exo-alpha-sialidase n=1 Tax=Leptospira andrefontaineae TaxID=2484976 RepID=A0A4R9H5B0_9LEPT|nr:hypothetical protein [Leptospira andrefontaineae]TGK40345.1 hypothetical protein EHO65_09530 [Leptospira andrefontaineae]